MWEAFTLDALYLVLRRFILYLRIRGMANGQHSWLVYKIVDIIKYRAIQHPAVIVSGIITNVLIVISILSAFPWVRK